MIPTHLWVSISLNEKHTRIPLFMSLSKSIRQAFLVQSPDIIRWYLYYGYDKLPKWCWLLHPMPLGPLRDHISTHAPRHPAGWISGGSICQLAFGSQWESDLDVFIEREGVPESRELIGNVDSIYVNSVRDRIASFDLSICQVAVTKDEIYCTPAFLFSLRSNTMLIRVSPIAIFYLHEHDGIPDPTPTFVCWMFNKHKEEKHEFNDFHTCQRCVISRWGDSYDLSKVYKWFDRIKKYQGRFPEMQRIFINE